MPYTPPSTTATSPALSPSKSCVSLSSCYKGWSIGQKKSHDDLDVIANDKLLDNEKDRDSALREVKDILSTSPQLSTSPRRKSAPESYSRKLSLRVNLPILPLPEIPCILRKKSGEVVKPSLKKGLSKSEPVTPTFPKYVHFDADLEQIRLFNEAQKPQAISADVSSDEEDTDDDDDDDDDFDFSASDEEDDVEEDDDELVISLPNRPVITTMHSSNPLFVESIYLSQDKRKLQGRILVQNIAFRKIVEVRYTFDFWSTVSQISANYAEGAPSKDDKKNYDVFVFSIDLIDNSRNPIDGKTMYFAVHYKVENNDFWDNNNGSNYQVNFKRVKRPPPSKPKKRSNASNVQNTSSKWSMTSIPKQINKSLDESLARSPTLGSPPKFIPSTVDSRKKLVGRYDIGVSLSAAQNVKRSSIPSTPSTPSTPSNPAATRTFQSYFNPQVTYSGCNYNNENFQAFFPNTYIDGMPGTSEFSVSNSSSFEPMKQNSNPIAIPSSKPSIGSSSYYELVNQYCFYSGSPYASNNHPYASSPPVMT
ncbi:Carbohydrate-Binding Module Family 21 protein [Glomus cerebriforme]|uniref:Carbohydrate-Binding Module Family 21 protein n=1 Tax=Glomus cerebriforme TaxID=658196 RepID=A0A397SX54_9GLOM|nr:Carbohydrate-Binding Module Family 21 protein [Glomus cerebriforme]